MRARVTRDGTISAKNSTFGYFDGTNPITGKGIQLQSPTWKRSMRKQMTFRNATNGFPRINVWETSAEIPY